MSAVLDLIDASVTLLFHFIGEADVQVARIRAHIRVCRPTKAVRWIRDDDFIIPSVQVIESKYTYNKGTFHSH